MSLLRICDTCPSQAYASRVELDVEDPNVIELPEGWTQDDIGRDSCPTCNSEVEQFEEGIPSEEENAALVKELKKETRKLKKAEKAKKKGEVPDVE